jgi:enamine deaminase RidA (YjgF/YER057c/UK114 family)
MNIKRIGAGSRMSEAVIHGNKVYLSGFVAESTVGKPVNEQTADILAQIDETLKQAGTSKANILKANIWLTDISTFALMNEAWDAWVVAGQTPARATVESKLAAPGLDVEIMVEAAIDRPNARGAGAAKKAGARKAGAKAGPRRAAKKAAKKAARKAAKK